MNARILSRSPQRPAGDESVDALRNRVFAGDDLASADDHREAKTAGVRCRAGATVVSAWRRDAKPEADATKSAGTVGTAGRECRVYYDVVDEPEPVVTVLAVGIKVRARVIIGGEEVRL